MKIEGIIWLNQIVDKLAFKHQIETYEVEEMLNEKPRFRFVEKGERKNEDVYMALGQTAGGNVWQKIIKSNYRNSIRSKR